MRLLTVEHWSYQDTPHISTAHGFERISTLRQQRLILLRCEQILLGSWLDSCRESSELTCTFLFHKRGDGVGRLRQLWVDALFLVRQKWIFFAAFLLGVFFFATFFCLVLFLLHSIVVKLSKINHILLLLLLL